MEKGSFNQAEGRGPANESYCPNDTIKPVVPLTVGFNATDFALGHLDAAVKP